MRDYTARQNMPVSLRQGFHGALFLTYVATTTLTAWKATCTVEHVLHEELVGFAMSPLTSHDSNKTATNKESTTYKGNKDTPVDFIPTGDLDPNYDVFAASWWQSVERFLQLDTETIKTVEDDSFAPVLRAGRGFEDSRMALDWLDFSIEHLSKWWKLLDEGGLSYGTGKLQAYVQRVMTNKQDSSEMESTLAVIPYGVSTHDPRAQQLWFTSLAATIASLIRHGVGRVVVVGYYTADTKLTKKAFDLLLHYEDDATDIEVHENESFSTTVGMTQLAYVRTADVNSTYIPINVPKGALKGLQQAIRGMKEDPQQWIGTTPEKYKYIYLTEADQILHARLSADFPLTMDEGRIIIPHRLQPIPHPLDLEGSVSESTQLLPSDQFSHVHELSGFDSCCDTTEKPGRQHYPPCGGFWWTCGFRSSRNHSRISSYDLMRLSDGTGIVSLASTEHSRKCIPKKKDGGCKNKKSKIA